MQAEPRRDLVHPLHVPDPAAPPVRREAPPHGLKQALPRLGLQGEPERGSAPVGGEVAGDGPVQILGHLASGDDFLPGPNAARMRHPNYVLG